MSHKIEKEKQEYLQEQTRKEQEKRYKDYCVSHGTKPVSRRDFLGAGLMSFSATMTAPTLAGMLLPQQARAQSSECPSAGGGNSGLMPFMTLNLAGGAMLASNYVPTDQGGQPLPSYNRMGLGDGAVPIEREFGNVPFAGSVNNDGVLISKMLEQIRATTSAGTRANTSFVAIPVRSRDDFGMNPFDASGMVAKAGLLGSDLPNLGRRASDTGVNQNYAHVKPPTPLIVGNYGDIQGALGLGRNDGPLAGLSGNQKSSLLRLVQNLSETQTNRVNANAGGRMLASLVKCATGKNVELSEKEAPASDVRGSELEGVWGVNQNTGDNDENVVFGSMVRASLTGLAGTVSLERGGYDYHNGTRTTGDERDGLAGAVIGRMLESAATLNQKMFLYVTSDGSCVSEISNDRNSPWRSDRGSAGIAFMIAYDPAGRPQTRGHQLGAFTEGQAADTSFITGGSPELTSAAVFANYLSLNGRMDLLEPTIGNVLSTADLSTVMMFG